MRSLGIVSIPIFNVKFGIAAHKSAFPARSPYPLMHPWTWVAPASTAAKLFATAHPLSLWKWTPSTHEVLARTSETTWDAPAGSIPPFVSHSTSASAPEVSAASRRAREKSRSSAKPSKKCSASRKTRNPCSRSTRTESVTIATASSGVVRSVSRTWPAADLATMQAMPVPALSSRTKERSSSAATCARLVDPNATSCALSRTSSSFARSKNCSSFGFAPGQPPSMYATPRWSS